MASNEVSRRNFLRIFGLGFGAVASGSALETIAGQPYRRNQRSYSHPQLYCKRLRNGRVVYYRVYTRTHAPHYREREGG
ncbi:hypothetical protein J4221_06770 [Candidatus Pacearchaeota archaeon]|nr:hypothetical protein [Candidatus Pacearchaeota archaeon]